MLRTSRNRRFLRIEFGRIPRDGGIDAPRSVQNNLQVIEDFTCVRRQSRGAQRRREQESGANPRQETSKGFAQNPAPTAPHNRIPLPSSNGESDFRSGRRLMQKQQPHQLAANAYAGAEDTVKLPCFFQSCRSGKTTRQRAYTVSRFLPFALLLRRTFLPPVELERARNPIFRFLGLLCG